MIEMENTAGGSGYGNGACIKVIGVGGGGGNAVNTMVDAGIEGVEFIAANTDVQALANNRAVTRIQLGEQKAHGLGAGGKPSVGLESAQESASMLQDVLKGADMVFVTAGMGGGTGTGAAPFIAGLAKQLGALTVGVVTKPFKFEGRKRKRQAEEGIENLKKNVDTLITIPNERLLSTSGEQMTLIDAFRRVDNVLLDAVHAISEIVTKIGEINIDFADVQSIMQDKGLALMGTGVGEGPNRATDAAEAAISSPLLDDISIEGATSILYNMTAPRNATLLEISNAASLIENAAAEDANIIWGHFFSEDENSEEFKITIIATGFAKNDALGEMTSSDKFGNAISGQGGFLDPPSRVFSSQMNPIVSMPSTVMGAAAMADSRSNSEVIGDRLRALENQSEPELEAAPGPRASYAPAAKPSYAPKAASKPATAQSSDSGVFPPGPDIYAQQKPVVQSRNPKSSHNEPIDAGFLDDSMAIPDDPYGTPSFMRKKKNFLDV